MCVSRSQAIPRVSTVRLTGASAYQRDSLTLVSGLAVPVGVMCGTVPYQAVGWSACQSSKIISASPLLIPSHPAAPRMQLARIMQHRSTSWPPQTASRHIPRPCPRRFWSRSPFPRRRARRATSGTRASRPMMRRWSPPSGTTAAPSPRPGHFSFARRRRDRVVQLIRAIESNVWQLAWTSESV
jgi:hypothetical protein